MPDIIIPCDDRIVGHLCALRALGDDTSTLIETSLGRGGASGVLAKRATLGEISLLPNVDVPRTDNVATASDLRDWVRKFGLPAMLKLDGSWRGKVLAQIAVEVVESASPFGMATVVHVIDGDAMVAAARSICSHYMLSGLHGFDFIIDERNGAPKLIEI